jgi:hypothetical protein
MSRLQAANEVDRRTRQRMFDLGRDPIRDYKRTMREILYMDEDLKCAYAGVAQKTGNPPVKSVAPSTTSQVHPSRPLRDDDVYRAFLSPELYRAWQGLPKMQLGSVNEADVEWMKKALGW